jgi:DNA-binding XRE family transcriptional regulator
MKIGVNGKELAKARYKKGLSIHDMAKEIKVSTKTIVDTENGNSLPTPKTLKKICSFLEIDLSDIVA